jgi:MoaA/NifB/PqqE/SkfB family radical SAM enzyme
VTLERITNIINYHLPTLIKIELKKTWPSLFHKIPIRPIIAGLQITERCNLRCQMCGVWSSDSRVELTTEEWKEVFRQLRQEEIKYLYFAGGEPLLREDLADLVSFAHSLGFRVIIATNGYLLTEELARKLIDSGVKYFNVSLDALGGDFNSIRGVEGAYEKVSSACKILSKLRKDRDIEVAICATIMKSTLRNILKVVQFADSLDIPILFSLLDCTPYFFHSAKNDNLWIGESERGQLKEVVEELIRAKRRKKKLIKHSYASLLYINRYFKDPLRKDIPCAKAFTRVFIGPEGKVFGGCWSMGYFGDLRGSRLKEIIHSEEYRLSHRKRFLKECPGCSCGYDVDLKYSLRYLWQEMKFRLTKGEGRNGKP